MNPLLPTSNSRTCLQLLVLVSLLWVGPIPVGHSHADSATSTNSSSDLEQHLLLYHHCNLCENTESRWHWHWVIRGAAYAGIGSEAAVTQPMSSDVEPAHKLGDQRLAKSLGKSIGQPLSVDSLDCLCWSADQPAEHARLVLHRLAGHHVWRISASPLSSVMRC